VKEITIICPIFNEEKNIDFFINAFNKIFKEHSEFKFSILFADNASTDNSYQVLKSICNENQNIKYVRYEKNNGVMRSIFTAISLVECDACSIFDCDLQDDPNLLNEFIKNWKNGYKIIYGKRIKRKEIFILSIFRNIFKKISYILRGFDIKIESGAWFLDKEAIKEIKDTEFDPFLPALIERLAFSKKGVEYERVERKHGLSKFNFLNYLNYATDGLVSGTIKPLRLSIYFSFLFAFISFFSAIYFVVAKFYLGIVFAEGIAAIIIINLFSFTLIFLFFGILGEYIGKIYLKDENKKSPKIKYKINL
tara:strand:+ start:772 stop:1695 length:924 start_codon:yes stop_codon:yes gene_type:complete